MNENSTPIITLNNGLKMPQLGLGVWKAKDGEEVENAVSAALEAGYRLIDTASVYGNEQGVGKAIKSSGIQRKDIFVTTKLWNDDQGADKVRPAFQASLDRLGLDYVDLYLIHWPTPERGLFVETWKEFEKLLSEGKTRAIGVSNFRIEDIDELKRSCDVLPAVNQIELHPDFSQIELREYCQQNNIYVESWSPLGGVKGSILTNQTLADIGAKYAKSSAQVAIRWHLQNNLVVIPKSVHADRIKQNIDVFDFELSSDDMAAIDQLNSDNRQGRDPTTTEYVN